MNLPHLRNYYWAAQLSGVIMWITKDLDTIWMGMGCRACINIPQQSLPFVNVTTRRKLKIKNGWIKRTMQVLSTLKKK